MKPATGLSAPPPDVRGRSPLRPALQADGGTPGPERLPDVIARQRDCRLRSAAHADLGVFTVGVKRDRTAPAYGEAVYGLAAAPGDTALPDPEIAVRTATRGLEWPRRLVPGTSRSPLRAVKAHGADRADERSPGLKIKRNRPRKPKAAKPLPARRARPERLWKDCVFVHVPELERAPRASRIPSYRSRTRPADVPTVPLPSLGKAK